MIVRKVDENVTQSDYEYAVINHNRYDIVISVAKEHNHNWNTLYIPQVDLQYIDTANFIAVVNAIGNAIKQGKRVLLYCNAGMSRSVTYAIAYLLKKGYDVNSAKRKLGVDYNLHPDMERSLRDFALRITR